MQESDNESLYAILVIYRAFLKRKTVFFFKFLAEWLNSINSWSKIKFIHRNIPYLWLINGAIVPFSVIWITLTVLCWREKSIFSKFYQHFRVNKSIAWMQRYEELWESDETIWWKENFSNFQQVNDLRIHIRVNNYFWQKFSSIPILINVKIFVERKLQIKSGRKHLYSYWSKNALRLFACVIYTLRDRDWDQQSLRSKLSHPRISIEG